MVLAGAHTADSSRFSDSPTTTPRKFNRNVDARVLRRVRANDRTLFRARSEIKRQHDPSQSLTWSRDDRA